MIVISAENVSKGYPLYASASKRFYDALFQNPKLKRFYALENINFELQKGETLGVLGVNGSGKSTLLKILAGVVQPSSGTLKVNGKISALLELGAGFNMEFTGIENAKMALSIAGLDKSQVEHALEDALSFADIGSFASLPVKLYSSGMFVRLAFACATVSKPEILLIDEALSVGDLFFQAKCIKRLKNMLQNGATLVFVSHDIGAVKSICKKCLLLNNGRQEMLDRTDLVAQKYFSLKVQSEQPSAKNQYAEIIPLKAAGEISEPLSPAVKAWNKKIADQRTGDGQARFISVSLLNKDQQNRESFAFGEEALLQMQLMVHQDLDELCIGYHIQNASGVDVIYSDSGIEQCNLKNLKAGEIKIMNWRFRLHLGEGAHNIVAVCSMPVDLASSTVTFCDHVHCAAQFSMERRSDAKIYSLAYWKNEVSIHDAK